MMRTIGLFLLASLALMAVAQAAPAKTAPSKARQVDKLFAEWNSPASPGASVAVLQNGKIIYSHGYGMASLEYGAPNSPATVFHVASISKQFTAFAILLLARDGKLSLDDDIRKYLPEMHDFGTPITIREMLHHTSGLRDQWRLLALAGWRLEDVITEQDILNLLWRQKELNFPPGDQMLYSNTGYTLLGLIVKRVSGMPLSQFAQQRIFRPLGMSRTHFQDDYSMVVKNRAYSYAKGQDGKYKYVALSYSTVGPSSLFTTVEDMAKWDENFYTGKVGGKQLIADIQLKGRLNNGAEIAYADGLSIRKYRGLNTVGHDGGDAGYRTDILRFPDQHFSVVVLCNAAEMDPIDLSQKIADIYLAGEMEAENSKPVPAAASPPKRVSIDPKLMAAYVGDYYSDELRVLYFVSVRDGRLSVRYPRGELALQPTATDVYAAGFPIGTLEFTRDTDGTATGFTIDAGRVRKLRFDKVTIAPATSPPIPQASRPKSAFH